jgi:hypothetical protein
MLGLAKHSQLAGWGGGPLKISYDNTSVFVPTSAQTPDFSFRMNNTDRNWDVNNTGQINLTGYTSLTGYHRWKYTAFAHVYLPSTGSGNFTDITANQYYGSTFNTSYYDYAQYTPNSFNHTLTINTNSNTEFRIDFGYETGGPPNVILPGSYTNYLDRWLTIVSCRSNTVNDFTAWNPTNQQFGTVSYMRTAVFDTLTGVLIVKKDQYQSGSFTQSPDPATLPTTLNLNSNNWETGTIGFQVNGFGGGDKEPILGGFWCGYGTMFDPLTSTDRSWLTKRPNSTIGTAVAWINGQYTTDVTVGGQTAVRQSDSDLYSQADNALTKTYSSQFTTAWTNNYPIKNQG